VGGGHEIIDYKTGPGDVAKARTRAEQYEMQMQAYALAAEAITGEKVLATRLVFPAAGEVVTREMTTARRREARRDIERIVTGIEAHEYGIKAKPPCEGCIYHTNGMCWEDRTRRSGRKGTGKRKR
jgi:CRISPR/Cas system-associated exonuclease Cas4 (RecB family)